MDYIVDFGSNPVTIDLLAQSPDGNARINMKGLLQFIDNNTIKFQIFPTGFRPDNFDLHAKQMVLILKRVKS